MAETSISVLLVEDNPADARLLAESLREAGPAAFDVTVVRRLSAAIDTLASSLSKFDVIALDLSLPDSSGLQTVERVQAVAPNVPIVVLTGLQDEKLALTAVRRGVQDYLIKGQSENGLAARALRYAVGRQRLHATLQQSEQRFRSLFDHSLDAILIADDSSRIVDANAAACALVGVDRDKLTAMTVPDLAEEQARAATGEQWRQFLQQGEARGEFRLARPDGSVRDLEFSAKARFLENLHLSILRDVTDIRRAHAAVRASEAQLRDVLEHLPVGVWFTDADGKIIFGNPAGRRIWGGARHVEVDQYAQYKGWWLQTGGRIGSHEWALARALKNGEASLDELVEIESFDGIRKIIRNSAVPLRRDDRDVTGAIVINEDVTEQHKAEQRLRDREARYRAVVDTAADAVVTIDEQGTIESVNASVERMFGYDRQELMGQNVRMLMSDPFRQEHDSSLQRYLQTGVPRVIGIGREVIGLRRDGSTFPVSLSVSEFQIAGHRMFTGILHDLTGRRKLEQQVLEASAEEQRRIGRDLHDGLCQELLGISFSLELLAQRLPSDERAQQIAAAAREIGGTVRAAIDQARSLAHGLNPVAAGPQALSMALRALCSRVSEQSNVQISFQSKGKEPPLSEAICTHLYRIVQEAISNAIRHGKAKRIDVKLKVVRPSNSLELSIQDDGQGLPPDRLERPIAAAEPGQFAGMGLQTMAYRAKLMGGHLMIHPLAPHGTEVICQLPPATFPRPVNVAQSL